MYRRLRKVKLASDTGFVAHAGTATRPGRWEIFFRAETGKQEQRTLWNNIRLEIKLWDDEDLRKDAARGAAGTTFLKTTQYHGHSHQKEQVKPSLEWIRVNPLSARYHQLTVALETVPRSGQSVFLSLTLIPPSSRTLHNMPVNFNYCLLAHLSPGSAFSKSRSAHVNSLICATHLAGTGHRYLYPCCQPHIDSFPRNCQNEKNKKTKNCACSWKNEWKNFMNVTNNQLVFFMSVSYVSEIKSLSVFPSS